jgi:hypothetical protein
MAVQGLDVAGAPQAPRAKQMLDHIGGRWWNVYIGGPYSRGARSWTPELVRDYVRHGIDRFMLTYVGQQYGGSQNFHGTLTRERGLQDGRDALACARRFGYSGNVPLCLDVELSTYESRRSGTVEYARAWCETVRAGGARPGVYANVPPLEAMWQGGVKADFVWVARWVDHAPGQHDPHAIRDLPAGMWPRPGERAWQYAGGPACAVLGVHVDISVADLGCLAPPPGAVKGVVASAAAHHQALRTGDRGPVVVRLTHRLSTIRSPSTGKPYLDGPRKRFDAAVHAALSAFQHDHRLPANGVYDATSARALLTVAKRQKQSRHAVTHARRGAAEGAGAGARAAGAASGNGATKQASAATSLPALVARFQRLDAEANHSWQQIEAYGERSRRRLARAEAERRAGLPGIAASLRGIEHQLEDLVGLERRELAAIEHEAEPATAQAVAAPADRAGDAPARGAGEASSASAAPTAAAPAAQPADRTAIPAAAAVAGDGVSPPPPAPAERLGDLTTAELDARIDSLDQQLDDLRRERIARYARTEKRLRREAEGTSVAAALQRRPAATARAAAARPNGQRPAGRRPRPAAARQQAPAEAEDATSLQHSLNRFAHRFLANVAPLRVDGSKGSETDKRIKTAKYYLGYAHHERTAAVTPEFIRRLRHPRREPSPQTAQSRAAPGARPDRGHAKARDRHDRAADRGVVRDPPHAGAGRAEEPRTQRADRRRQQIRSQGAARPCVGRRHEQQLQTDAADGRAGAPARKTLRHPVERRGPQKRVRPRLPLPAHLPLQRSPEPRAFRAAGGLSGRATDNRPPRRAATR